MSATCSTSSGSAALDYRVVPERVAGAPRAALVLLHGHGESPDQLLDLPRAIADRCPALHDVRYIVPQAPLGRSRAWWKLDYAQLSNLRAGDSNALHNFCRHTSAGMRQARGLVLQLIGELCRQTGLRPNRIALGGFSQGAILAIDVALHMPEPALAVAAFSGALMHQAEWSLRARRSRGLPVLVAHGSADPLLPMSLAERLVTFLGEHALEVEFECFEGGHALPADASDRLAAFLGRLMP